MKLAGLLNPADRPRKGRVCRILQAALLAVSVCAACPAQAPPVPQPRHWEFFTTRDGLPDDRIRTLAVAGDTLAIGTDAGLAIATGRSWRAWRDFDGDARTPPPVVAAIAIDPATRELWIGTLGAGLYRLSAGRFDHFDQFNSGLAGDVVFATAFQDGALWAATNGGVSSYTARAEAWRLCGERSRDHSEQVVLGFTPAGDGLRADVWEEGAARLTRGNADAPGPLVITDAPHPSDAAAVLRQLDESARERLAALGVRCAAVAGDGEFWIGTGRGLVHVCRERAQLWGGSREFPPQPATEGGAAAPAGVRIGVLSSANPTMALPGGNSARTHAVDLPAVALAIEEANAAGGWRGVAPFELVHDLHGYGRYGWSLPEDDLAALAFQTDVCGVIGWIEPRDRFMQALANRADTPIVNASSDAPRNCMWSFSKRPSAPAEEEEFQERYRQRHRRPAPPDAWPSYCAARTLLVAITSAGPDRAAVAARLRAATGDPPAPSAPP